MKYKYIAECSKCPQLRNETPTPIRSPNFVAMCWGQEADGHYGPAFFKGDKLEQKISGEPNDAPPYCQKVIKLLSKLNLIWELSSAVSSSLNSEH